MSFVVRSNRYSGAGGGGGGAAVGGRRHGRRRMKGGFLPLLAGGLLGSLAMPLIGKIFGRGGRRRRRR